MNQTAMQRLLSLLKPGAARIPNPPPESIAGTVKAHSSYIFLHAPSSPQSFPPRPTTDVHRHLDMRTRRWGGVVNFSWAENQHRVGSDWDSDSSENWVATAWSMTKGWLEVPNVSMDNLDIIAQALQQHASADASGSQLKGPAHIYVCTHGQRDCRCGQHGGELAEALRSEVKRRGVENKIRVLESGHIGGHEWAATVLVFPMGEWLGHLRAYHAPAIIDAVLAAPQRPFTIDDPPTMLLNWRGRTSLSRRQMTDIAGVAYAERSTEHASSTEEAHKDLEATNRTASSN